MLLPDEPHPHAVLGVLDDGALHRLQQLKVVVHLRHEDGPEVGILRDFGGHGDEMRGLEREGRNVEVHLDVLQALIHDGRRHPLGAELTRVHGALNGHDQLIPSRVHSRALLLLAVDTREAPHAVRARDVAPCERGTLRALARGRGDAHRAVQRKADILSGVLVHPQRQPAAVVLEDVEDLGLREPKTVVVERVARRQEHRRRENNRHQIGGEFLGVEAAQHDEHVRVKLSGEARVVVDFALVLGLL